MIKGLQLNPLHSCYVVSGDEILLHTEACDAIRVQAQTQGFTERHRFSLDGRSYWHEIIELNQSMSLFGDKKLIDIQLAGGKPGRLGAAAIVDLCAQFRSQATDVVFLFQLPYLDRSTKQSKWAKSLASHSQWLDVPLITKNQLPQWLQQRAQQNQQRFDNEALQWLSQQVEGNLLAAHQEIQKMSLLYPHGELNVAQVQAAVLNVARYNVFDLREAMLSGQAQRALHILHGLRAEGVALALVLWAIGDEIRLLALLAALQQSGSPLQSTLRAERVFGAREQLLLQCLKRVPATSWPAAVRHAHEVDKLIKGLAVPGSLNDPWEEAARLCLRVALAA